jgi:hypothetical protein
MSPVPFRNVKRGGAFRRSGQPATLWRKVADDSAVVDGTELVLRMSKKECVWLAAPVRSES